MRRHVGTEPPVVGALLPLVARHLVEQRPLAVHHFVVRDRQHELLRPRVNERERDQRVMVATVDRVECRVPQRVVHPAHVPLEVEAEAAEVRGLRDAGERRRLFGEHHRARVILPHSGVQLTQEIDGVEVLAAAIAVRHPLPGLAAVVQVEHRGDRVHAQAVHVIVVEPVQRVRDEEVAHLVPAVVEDLGAPVGVLAEPGIRVFVERAAVELGEAVRVAREVRGHPVHDHADPRLVAAIDEPHEVPWRAETRGRRVIPHDLVAPGTVEGVLGDAHQLDVRVPHVLHIGDQLVGDLRPVEELRRARVVASPRRRVDFVDGDGLRERIDRPRAHPRLVAPGVAVDRRDDRAVVRSQLHREAVRVGLQDRPAGTGADFVLVSGAGAQVRNEKLPDARAAARLHRVLAAVPEVERTHHAHAFRIRRPHGESRAGQPVERGRMRAELVVDRVVVAFAEQVEVEVGELRREEIRVVLGRLGAAAIPDLQAIGMQRPAIRHPAFEQPARVDALQLRSGATVLPQHGDGDGVGLEHADHAGRRVVLAGELVVTEQ